MLPTEILLTPVAAISISSPTTLSIEINGSTSKILFSI